ncbi:MAG: sulfotransferase domain-containing protein, partial [Bacteroidia bacterium]|nr:sulfotransferase domain-containing protein [Bacteroidia bacterium]
YYGVGEYKKQLERYTGLFEKQQVLILMSDELFSDPRAVLSRIFSFLEVDNTFQPDFSKKYNEYKEPRFKIVNRFKNSKTLRWIFDRLPGSFQKIASKTAFDESREKPSLMAEKDLLQNWYSDEIQELEQLLDRDLSSWKQTSKTGE